GCDASARSVADLGCRAWVGVPERSGVTMVAAGRVRRRPALVLRFLPRASLDAPRAATATPSPQIRRHLRVHPPQEERAVEHLLVAVTNQQPASDQRLDRLVHRRAPWQAVLVANLGGVQLIDAEGHHAQDVLLLRREVVPETT